LKANHIMTKDLVVCHPDQTVGEVIDLLRGKSFRVLPVVDKNNKILGAVNLLGLVSKFVPEYLITGDLTSISYAPDMGVLRKQYTATLDRKVSDIMDRDPTVVRESDSLLSVTATLITYDRFEYAFVADKKNVLLGLIAASDILRCLSKFDSEVLFDA